MPTRERIRNFIMAELIKDGSKVEVTDTVPLIDAGIIDSFGIMTLMGYIEENFSIEIAPDELVPENFASVASISDFLLQKNCTQPGG